MDEEKHEFAPTVVDYGTLKHLHITRTIPLEDVYYDQTIVIICKEGQILYFDTAWEEFENIEVFCDRFNISMDEFQLEFTPIEETDQVIDQVPMAEKVLSRPYQQSGKKKRNFLDMGPSEVNSFGEPIIDDKDSYLQQALEYKERRHMRDIMQQREIEQIKREYQAGLLDRERAYALITNRHPDFDRSQLDENREPSSLRHPEGNFLIVDDPANIEEPDDPEFLWNRDYLGEEGSSELENTPPEALDLGPEPGSRDDGG